MTAVQSKRVLGDALPTLTVVDRVVGDEPVTVDQMPRFWDRPDVVTQYTAPVAFVAARERVPPWNRRTTGRTDLVVGASDCGVTASWFDSHRGRLCLLRQPLRYTALGTGCAPLPQCLDQLSLSSFRGR